MKNKIISFGIVSFIIFGGFFGFITFKTETVQGAGTTLYVGGTGASNYTIIQNAIDAANDGDTIFVYKGSYFEHLKINKQIELIGEDKETTVIFGNRWDRAIKIIADGVKVSGFTLGTGYASVSLSGTSNCDIMNNIISNGFGYGILIGGANNCNIKNNKILENEQYGIYLVSSSNIKITDNIFEKNGIFIDGNELAHFNSHNIPTSNIVNGEPLYYYKDSDGINIDGLPIGQLILTNCTNMNIKNLQIIDTEIGIEILYSTNIRISNSNISSNKYGGIFLSPYSTDNLFKGNYISKNKYGIHFNPDSHNNIILNNDICFNDPCGVFADEASNINTENNEFNGNNYGIYASKSLSNEIINNTFSSNNNGIYLESSHNNEIINNEVSNNENGINLFSSNNNKIYHNSFINNINQSLDNTNGKNRWNESYPLGGNYWSDHSLTCPDLYSGVKTPQTSGSPDGICDDEYIIESLATDFYPLKKPWSEFSPPDAPINLIANPGNSYINISWKIPPDSDDELPITNYIIYRSLIPNEEAYLKEIDNVLYYNDTNVINGIIYYYKVSAKNIAGEGALSNKASAIPGASPSVPTLVTAEAEKSSIKITWGAPVFNSGFNITNYRIYRGTSPDNIKYIAEITGNNQYYIDKNVIKDVVYYYKISAKNKIGEGPLSNEAECVIKESPSDSGQSIEISGWWLGLIIIIIVISAIIVIIIGFVLRKKLKKQHPQAPPIQFSQRAYSQLYQEPQYQQYPPVSPPPPNVPPHSSLHQQKQYYNKDEDELKYY
ncbi:MAG: right-handed parallel beta-helix repeat-containing protein [Thermoplasmata archaeon]|nr:right-handed parallel beta-helix repeat-containing protein [Thermoplasmata archaeon]